MVNSEEDIQAMQEMSLQDYIEYQAGFVIRDEAVVIADKFKRGSKIVRVYDQQITFKKSRRSLLVDELKELGYICYYTQVLPKHKSRGCCWCFKVKNYHTLPDPQWYLNLASRTELQ